jgi:hypothetical protein
MQKFCFVILILYCNFFINPLLHFSAIHGIYDSGSQPLIATEGIPVLDPKSLDLEHQRRKSPMLVAPTENINSSRELHKNI